MIATQLYFQHRFLWFLVMTTIKKCSQELCRLQKTLDQIHHFLHLLSFLRKHCPNHQELSMEFPRGSGKAKNPVSPLSSPFLLSIHPPTPAVCGGLTLGSGENPMASKGIWYNHWPFLTSQAVMPADLFSLGVLLLMFGCGDKLQAICVLWRIKSLWEITHFWKVNSSDSVNFCFEKKF